MDAPSWGTVNRLLLSPNEQARELQQSLGALAGSGANAAVVSGPLLPWALGPAVWAHGRAARPGSVAARRALRARQLPRA